MQISQDAISTLIYRGPVDELDFDLEMLDKTTTRPYDYLNTGPR